MVNALGAIDVWQAFLSNGVKTMKTLINMASALIASGVFLTVAVEASMAV